MKLLGFGTKPDFDHETCEWLNSLFIVTVEQDFGEKKRIGITIKISPVALQIVPQLKSYEMETYAKMFEKKIRAALIEIAKSYGDFDNLEDIVEVIRLKAPLIVRKAANMHTFHQNMTDGFIVDSEQFFKDAAELNKCKDGIIDKLNLTIENDRRTDKSGE